MLRSVAVLLVVASVAVAGSIENRPSPRFPSQPKAENRDGVHHGSGGGKQLQKLKPIIAFGMLSDRIKESMETYV